VYTARRAGGMVMRSLCAGGLLAFLSAGCRGAPPLPAPPRPALSTRVELGPPWRLQKQNATCVIVQYGDSPDGVRVTLDRGVGRRPPGASPIRAGKTLETLDDGSLWPLVAVGFPDRPLSEALVLSDGPDLVVRLLGPPLRTLSPHPDAPGDSVLTLIRFRPRGADWRIVVDGLATLSFPGGLRTENRGPNTTLDTLWGKFELASEAPRSTQGAAPARWWWTSLPSLDLYEPYKRTTLTWTPTTPSPHPR
jgi:hypothetical protein